MASSSNALMDRSSLPFTWARRPFRASSSKPILHHNLVSKHNLPIPSPDASLMSLREWGCKCKLNRGASNGLPPPHPLPYLVSNVRTKLRRGTHDRGQRVSDPSTTVHLHPKPELARAQACTRGAYPSDQTRVSRKPLPASRLRQHANNFPINERNSNSEASIRRSFGHFASSSRSFASLSAALKSSY